MLLLKLLFVSCIGTHPTGANLLGWILGSSEPDQKQIVSSAPLKTVPFESSADDENFLQEAAKYTSLKLSDLDACQHRVVMQIHSSCSTMGDEELAKMSVQLLNCQSRVEGRPEFPCSSKMSLRECTTPMDADTWNTYHLMSNRARAVCYASRHQQFRALSELTVNKLMSSAHDQLAAMAILKTMLSLSELREENLLCDATIRLDDGSVFHIHRAILSACSMYFRAMFTTTLHPNGHTDIRLSSLAADTVNAILDYAYLRNVNIGAHNAVRLLVAADYLAMQGLLHLCCEYMRKQLTPINCIGIMRFARLFLDAEVARLATDAHRYVMRHFISVATDSAELLDLSLPEIAAVLGADTLNAKSEEPVWECALRWIGHNPEERKAHIVELLGNIRLGLLETQFFLEKVKDHPWVLAQDECRPIIIETLKFLYNLEMITQNNHEIPTPEIARPRVPHEVMFAMGGWSGGSPTNFIETYDTRADRWVRVEAVDPAGPRAYHGTAVLGFSIYVIGGFDGIEYFNSCRCFDAVEKIWKEVAPMNNCRCYVSVAVLGDLIFAMGGYDGHHRQNTAERFNHATNQWSVIAPMNAQRSDASATMLNGRIYITGGFNGQECMNTAEVYDPETNQWTLIAPMRSRRSGVSCIAYHKHVYVVGGFNGISRMCSGERYNPTTNTWAPVPDMYNPRSNFAIEVIDDMIFSIGGFNGVTTIYHVECYDEKTNEWYEATDMNMYRSALAACVIMGLPNLNDYIHKHRERLLEEKRQRRLLPDEGQHKLESMTLHTLDTVTEGHVELSRQQEQLQTRQLGLQRAVSASLSGVAREKAMIAATHARLAQMGAELRAQIEETSDQVARQTQEMGERHRQMLADLEEIQRQAKEVLQQVESRGAEALARLALASEAQESALVALARINASADTVLALAEAARREVELRFEWIAKLVGGDLDKLHYWLAHAGYLLSGMTLAAFLSTPRSTRYALLAVVAGNLYVGLTSSPGDSLDFFAMTILVVAVTAAAWALQLLWQMLSLLANKPIAAQAKLVQSSAKIRERLASVTQWFRQTLGLAEKKNSVEPSPLRFNRQSDSLGWDQSEDSVKGSDQSDKGKAYSVPLRRFMETRDSRSGTPFSQASASRRACAGLRKDGQHCRLSAATGANFCHHHSAGLTS